MDNTCKKHNQPIWALYFDKGEEKMMGICKKCQIQRNEEVDMSQIIKINELHTLMKKYNFGEKVKPNYTDLQQKFFIYFHKYKANLTEVIDSFDQISRNIINRIGFPFLKKYNLFQTFKHIKQKEYQKLDQKQLIQFISRTKKLENEEIIKKENQLYFYQLNKSQKIIKYLTDILRKFTIILKQYNINMSLAFDSVESYINNKIDSLRKELITEEKVAKTNSQTLSDKLNKLREKSNQKNEQRNDKSTHHQRKNSERMKSVTPSHKNMPKNRAFQVKRRQTMPESKKSKPEALTFPKQEKSISKSKSNQSSKPIPSLNQEIQRSKVLKSKVKKKISLEDNIMISSGLEKIAKYLSQKKKESQGEQRSSESLKNSTDLEMMKTILPGPEEVQSDHENEKVEVLPIKKKKVQPIKNQVAEVKEDSQLKKKINQQKNIIHELPYEHMHQQMKLAQRIDIKKDIKKLKLEEEESLSFLKQALALNIEEAIPKLEKALEICQNNVSAAEYLSYLYVQSQMFQKCLHLCNRFLKKTRFISDLKKDRIIFKTNKALSLNNLGRFSQTINNLQKIEQKNETMIRSLADAYLQLNKIEEAIIWYNQLLQNGRDEQTLYNLSVCYYLIENYQLANIIIKEVLLLKPKKQQYAELNKNIQRKIFLGH